MTTASAACVDHRLLEYGSDEEFVAGVAPFVLEGLRVGESALLVASPRNLAAVEWAVRKLLSTEIVANALQHGGTAARVTTWAQGSSFCCEVSDTGPGIADPIAVYRPPEPARGRCGLWLAQTFCDDLRIVTSPTGTTVRMSFTRH